MAASNGLTPTMFMTRVRLGQTASGGTFRTRVGAARIFGLVETGQGRITLTQPGRDALDNSGKERAARITAFLNAELFGVMYDQYKGNALPPPPAIERQMEQLGVSPKQKERARQTFMKSAQYAGFIDSSSGRFVKPGIAAKDELPPKDPPNFKRNGNDSGDGETQCLMKSTNVGADPRLLRLYSAPQWRSCLSAHTPALYALSQLTRPYSS